MGPLLRAAGGDRPAVRDRAKGPAALPRSLLLVSLVAAFGVGAPSTIHARPLTVDRLTPAADDPDNYLVDGRYQRGETRLARMRRGGELPDTIRGSGCRFDLAGDTGVAYYVRRCP